MDKDTSHNASTKAGFGGDDLLFDPLIQSSVAVRNNLLAVSKEISPAEIEIRAMINPSRQAVEGHAQLSKTPPPEWRDV